MVGIHIGVYLEDEACEGWFVRRYFTLFCFDGTGGRGYFDEAIQKLLYPEVIECRAEEDGGNIACKVFFSIEGGVDAIDELKIHTELLCLLGRDVLLELGRV